MGLTELLSETPIYTCPVCGKKIQTEFNETDILNGEKKVRCGKCRRVLRVKYRQSCPYCKTSLPVHWEEKDIDKGFRTMSCPLCRENFRVPLKTKENQGMIILT